MEASKFVVGDLTIPLFVGTMLNWGLQGTLAVQVYIYFAAFPRDSRVNKLLVSLIFLVDTVQTAGDTRGTLISLARDWGNPVALDTVGWAWFSVPVLGSLIAAVGQIFFAYRILVISNRSWVMPIIISAIALVQTSAGIWTGVLIQQTGRFSQAHFDKLKAPVVWLGGTALADVLIVVSTIYYLRKAQDPGFHSSTKAIVSRIIKVTVETGLICAVLAIIILSLYIKFDGNNFHLGACMWLSKAYSNSMMVILNSRAEIGHTRPQDVSWKMSDSIQLASGLSARTSQKSHSAQVERSRTKYNSGFAVRSDTTHVDSQRGSHEKAAEFSA